jgi:hypothetical protein
MWSLMVRNKWETAGPPINAAIVIAIVTAVIMWLLGILGITIGGGWRLVVGGG